MRRILATLTLTLTLAACTPLAAQPASSAGPHPTGARATTTAPVDWPAVIRRQHLERAWWAEVVRQQRAHAAYLRLLRYAQAIAASRAYPHGLCGGDLPPCWVRDRESGGDIRIWNGGCYAPVGWRGKSPCGSSSASGKWQAVRGTWNTCRTGYVNAADAPERVQDDCVRRIFDHGRGASHWRL